MFSNKFYFRYKKVFKFFVCMCLKNNNFFLFLNWILWNLDVWVIYLMLYLNCICLCIFYTCNIDLTFFLLFFNLIIKYHCLKKVISKVTQSWTLRPSCQAIVYIQFSFTFLIECKFNYSLENFILPVYISYDVNMHFICWRLWFWMLPLFFVAHK